MKVSIVVPTWENSEYTIKCYASVFKNMKPDTTLIWVDNASSDQEYIAVADWLGSHPCSGKVQIIRNSKNLGFVKATNQGIRLGLALGSDAILLLNNDTEMYSGCLDRLCAHLSHLDIVGPVSNNASQTTPQKIREVMPDFPLLRSASYSQYDSLLQNKYSNQIIPRLWVAFFCTLIKREAFNRIGVLDEAFMMGFRDDRDFCYTALKAGLKIGGALDVFVFHQLSATFKIADPYFRSGAYIGETGRILHAKHPEYATGDGTRMKRLGN